MSNIQKGINLNKKIFIIFICIYSSFSFRINTTESNGRMLNEDNHSKFLTKKNEIKNQTATEFAIALLKLPQFEPEERPNIPALQKSYIKEKDSSESEEESESSEENTESKKPEENQQKKPEELKNPSVDEIMNSNPMFQKRFGNQNSIPDFLNSNPMFQKSSKKKRDIQSELQNNPMFQKSDQNTNAEDYIKNNPLFKMNKKKSRNTHQESIEQRVAEMKKRREMQLQETLEERERLKKDPNAKPKPSKLKQQEQMKELFSVYNEFLKNDPTINDNKNLEPENLFEMYQNYLQDEIMKNTTYKEHMKEAANFFGYEDLVKEYEKKDEKIKEKKNLGKGDEETQGGEESLVEEESLIDGLDGEDEDSEENFESLIN